jgi:hypothetical protein
MFPRTLPAPKSGIEKTGDQCLLFGSKMGVPAKSIREMLEKLVPQAELVLEEWFPDALIWVAGDYIYVGDLDSGIKVSRTKGLVWLDYHGHLNHWGDLLDLFKGHFCIEDDKNAWRKLDTIRMRIERTTPEVRAEKARAREKRKREAEENFFRKLKEDIWRFIQQAGRMTPPPAGSKKRAKKTARAFWEWIFPLDGPVTAVHVKTAFEHWETTGDNLYFRVESRSYAKLTNWILIKTGKKNRKLFEHLRKDNV